MKSKHHYLDATRAVHEGLKGKKLSPVAIRKVSRQLASVMEFFNTSESNAMVLSSIVQASLIDGEVEMNALVSHYRANSRQLPKLCLAIDELREAGLIFRAERNDSRGHRRVGPFSFVMDVLIKNDREKVRPRSISSIADVFTEYNKLQSLRTRSNITHPQFVEQVIKLCQRAEHLESIRYLMSLRLPPVEVVMVLFMAESTFRGTEIVEINLILNEITDDAAEFYEWRGRFRNQDLALFREELVEFCFLELGLDTEIGLTMITRDRLFMNDPCKMIQMFRPQHCKLMLPENIAPVELIFDGPMEERLSAVRNSLEPDNYTTLCEKLKEKNLSGGLVVLFHGVPGTGKTESVYQLARRTNRAVLRIEISQIKAMWVGESEKNLKKVFTEYKQAKRKFQNHPILLFNEADALFSRRRNVGSAVDQMENAMQNILLQELEEFEGILVATTNLTQNMDAAFERRFLYRIGFQAPEVGARLRLLGANFGQLPEIERRELASQYTFTGSTLENIRRKLVLKELLGAAAEPGVDVVRQMIIAECTERSGRLPIGFRFGQTDGAIQVTRGNSGEEIKKNILA